MSGRSEPSHGCARRVLTALRATQTSAASSSVIQAVLRDTTCLGRGCLTKTGSTAHGMPRAGEFSIGRSSQQSSARRAH